MKTEIGFNPAPLLLGTGVFAVCTAWLAFGPDTSGPIGRLLRSNGRAVTIIAVTIASAMTLLFGLYAIRMALGMPALAASKHGLQIYISPIERLRWPEIDDVRIEAGKLLIVSRSGRVRRINLALLSDCDTAVVEIQEALTNRQG